MEGLEGIIERDIVGRVKREESKLKPGLRMDISWWEAVAFTFGSAVWVVNGELDLLVCFSEVLTPQGSPYGSLSFDHHWIPRLSVTQLRPWPL